jgi:hypothetical protein
LNEIHLESNKIETIGKSTFSGLSKLKEIPIMTLKYVVTNQSLYV